MCCQTGITSTPGGGWGSLMPRKGKLLTQTFCLATPVNLCLFALEVKIYKWELVCRSAGCLVSTGLRQTY